MQSPLNGSNKTTKTAPLRRGFHPLTANDAEEEHQDEDVEEEEEERKQQQKKKRGRQQLANNEQIDSAAQLCAGL